MDIESLYYFSELSKSLNMTHTAIDYIYLSKHSAITFSVLKTFMEPHSFIESQNFLSLRQALRY